MELYYFYVWFLIILGTHFIILFAYLHFSSKKDILNNITAFFAIFIVFINIPLILLLAYQDKDLYKFQLPVFLDSFIIPIFILSIIIALSSVLLLFFRFVFRHRNINNLSLKIKKKIQEVSIIKKDFLRKIWHIAIFISLFILWYLSFSYVQSYMSKKKTPKIDPKTTNMLYLYLRLLTKRNSIEEVLFTLEWFYYVLFFFFYILSLIILVNEFTRKTKYLGFPLNFIPFLLLSEEEKENYGTYLYFAIGHMFAAFICPPMAFFAILAMSSIGDLIPSQVGMRYGKKRISWNKKKTWEGSIAGGIAAFLLSYLFVGLFYSLIFAIMFISIDLFTRSPFNISDNLLIPIGCSLIFILVRFFLDFDYTPIILDLF